MNEDQEKLLYLRPSEITPSKLQPRKRFAKASILDMALSIHENGVEVGIMVRPLAAGGYELVYGERRWRGAGMCEDGIDEDHPPKEILIKCFCRELSDVEAFKIGVIENVEREDLSPLEEAHAYRQMQAMGDYSIRQLAAMFGGRIKKNRVHRLLRLLEMPMEWQKKVDSGEAPIYLIEEGFRVTEEQRELALSTAFEAGTRAMARERIDRRFVRPNEERAKWGDEKKRLMAGDDATLECLSYDECREIFPLDVEILGRIGKPSEFAVADEFPLSEDLAPGRTANRSWREYADHYGAPVYAVCDGRMVTRYLVRKALVKAAAAAFHEGEHCGRCQGHGVVGEGGESEACPECEGTRYKRKPSPELSPFPDETPEGKRRQKQDAEAERKKETAEAVKRADDIVRMVSTLEVAVRAKAGQPRNAPIMIEGALLVMDGYLLGIEAEKSPVAMLMQAMERLPRKNERPLAAWPDVKETPGFEAFCVCVLALYWLDQSESDDLTADSTWIRIAEAYGVEI